LRERRLADDAAARFLALATDLTPLGLLPQQGGD
jgi:hypothetical protein